MNDSSPSPPNHRRRPSYISVLATMTASQAAATAAIGGGALATVQVPPSLAGHSAHNSGVSTAPAGHVQSLADRYRITKKVGNCLD